MKILELFKGTGSVGKAILRHYPDAQVISVDIEAKFKPTIICDVMKLDYKQWKPGEFDLVWASPPCTAYSKMQDMVQAKNPGKIEVMMKEADVIVKRTLEIIEYLQPKRWFMENPQTGRLKSRPFMQDISFIDADYCKYGYEYKKRTRFWGTVDGLKLSKCCKSDGYCANFLPNPKTNRRRHQTAIGWSKSGGDNLYAKKSKTTLHERYSIPQPLLDNLLFKPKPKPKLRLKLAVPRKK